MGRAREQRWLGVGLGCARSAALEVDQVRGDQDAPTDESEPQATFETGDFHQSGCDEGAQSQSEPSCEGPASMGSMAHIGGAGGKQNGENEEDPLKAFFP